MLVGTVPTQRKWRKMGRVRLAWQLPSKLSWQFAVVAVLRHNGSFPFDGYQERLPPVRDDFRCHSLDLVNVCLAIKCNTETLIEVPLAGAASVDWWRCWAFPVSTLRQIVILVIDLFKNNVRWIPCISNKPSTSYLPLCYGHNFQLHNYC